MTERMSGRQSLSDLIKNSHQRKSDIDLSDLKISHPEYREVMAQCPKCKAVETLQFTGQTLLLCSKFKQVDGEVYHDCGSALPCRLQG